MGVRPVSSRPSAGMSLPELLVALLLGLIIIHLGLDSLVRLGSARRHIAMRTDALVTLRVSRHVMRTELRRGMAGTDWDLGGDSISIRAFRGMALICRVDSTSVGLVVPYVGDRAPDPTKDSVLLLTSEGRREVRALAGTSMASAPCIGSGRVGTAQWRFDASVPEGFVVARLFERGTYHLSGAALRYRRGASGRQPLTPEALAGASRWTASSGRVGLELVMRDTSAGPGWSGFLAGWRGP